MTRSCPTITFLISNMACSSCAASLVCGPGVVHGPSVAFRYGAENRTGESEMATIAAVDHGAVNERVKPEPLAAAPEEAESLVTVAPMRLLVVEDEIDLAEAVARGLRREGYAVDIAADGDEALEKLAYTEYDLVCLDLTLPKVDGREVCRRIREGSTASTDARVLMLTARDAIEDRVAGLDDGADDYLVKPYAFAELTARVRTLLRRDAGKSGAVLEVGDLRLDTARRVAWRGDRELDLTAKEFALLRYFMSPSRRGAVHGGPPRARVGRVHRSVHEHRPGDRRDAAPQAQRGRRAAGDRDVDRQRLPLGRVT